MSINKRIGILQFPGSNCDEDCIKCFREYFNTELIRIWHQDDVLPEIDGLIIPGGFSYGDYLRGGSLASHSKIMDSVRSFAQSGGSVIGICNGFQILTESHLLPGVLLRNDNQKFVCEFSRLKVAKGKSLYHKVLAEKTLSVPIAHGAGRYYIDATGLKRLRENGQIVFTYDSETYHNPNGSLEAIAGICSENGKVLGMMPHPERAVHELFGSEDGLAIWQAFLATIS
ncbi:MAG: phosphoribosylformylglycinamidine synthase subunit PurQ [Bdellovibrionota bacterium]